MKVEILGTIAVLILIQGASTTAALVNIAVDIDSTRILTGSPPPGPQTMPGFTSWDLTDFPFPGASLVVQGVTFDLFGILFSTGSRYRPQVSPSDVPGDDLLADFLYNEGSPGAFIGLRVSGLEVGTYAMKTWHYDGLSTVLRDSNFVQIEIRNQGEPFPPPIIDRFPFGFAPAEFQFNVTTAGQVKEVIIREDGDFFSRRSRLNGFILVSIPEPASLLLLSSTAIPLIAIRRKR